MTPPPRDALTFWRQACDRVRHPDTALAVPIHELRELVKLAEQGKRRTRRTKTDGAQNEKTVVR